MRKLAIILFLAFISQLSAQKYKYGVTANIHRGSIVHVHDVSTGKWGGGLGIFGEMSIVENDVYDSAWLYLDLVAEYSMQGDNAKADEALFGKQIYSNDYVAAMVYLKYFFHRGNYKRDFFVFAGPRVEYLVRDEKKVDPAYDAVYYQYNLDDELKKFGYGVSFGAGLKINQHFEAFLRYDRGFSKVYPNNSRNTYNRLLALGLNYYIQENWWN